MIATLAVLFILPGACRGQGFDKAVLDRIKDATVYIKVKVGNGLGMGSGFVIRASTDSVLIMTNRHVAVPQADEVPEGIKPEISAVFRSGTAQEQELPAKLVTYDLGEFRDLAMIEVKGLRELPTPIMAEYAAPESELYETMPAYSFGFPHGEMMQAIVGIAQQNPAVTVNAMTISSLRRDENRQLATIQLAGSIIGGNSGGPIVNAKGRLVGVVVARLNGESVGFAIPPNLIADFLKGHIGEIFEAEVLDSIGPQTRFRIAARLVDPLNRIQGMSIRYTRQPLGPDAFKPLPGGAYPLIEGGTSVALMVGKGTASGTFSLPINRPEDRKLHFQFVRTDTRGGVEAVAKPFPANIPNRLGKIVDLDAESRPKPTAKWSCETNLGEGIKLINKPGATVIDLPAGVPLVNAPQYTLFNAPCALLKVNGDFLAAVQVENTFDPGGEGVVVPSGKKLPFSFQSAGMLIWQDEKNFVRLERSKGSDPKTGSMSMLNRALVEVYKNGKEAAIHYIDVPSVPIILVAIRKGGSIQLFYATSQKKLTIFYEMPVDFNPEIFVGVSASNLSKRAFQAQLSGFLARSPDGNSIEPKPVKMAKLIDIGYVKLPDGTRIYEGAGLKVASPENALVVPQTNMADFKGEWSDNRQLLWNNDKSGQALSLELPVDADGKYEIKAKFTMAPDYAIAKLEIDGRPLYKGEKIDFYSKEVRPTSLMSLGTYSLNKGKRKLTITVFNKNAKSSGFHFGLDEIQLVPAK